MTFFETVARADLFRHAGSLFQKTGSVELMLGHRRRRWTNIKPSSDQRSVFAETWRSRVVIAGYLPRSCPLEQEMLLQVALTTS